MLLRDLHLEQTIGNYRCKEILSPPIVSLNLGISFEYTKEANASGIYNRKEKKIYIRDDIDFVFFHEIAHAIDDRFGNNIKDKEAECVAEIAGLIMHEYFMRESNFMLSYLFCSSKHSADEIRVIRRVKSIIEFVRSEYVKRIGEIEQ